MLIPSTITARRTLRYTSTLYIHHTIHGSATTLWMMAGGTVFSRRYSAIFRPPAHFSSAVYTWWWPLTLGPVNWPETPYPTPHPRSVGNHQM